MHKRTMKSQIAPLTCVLLLWKLTVLVSCADSSESPDIKVSIVSDGIKLSCGEKHNISSPNNQVEQVMALKYKDENTGEYMCVGGNEHESSKIYVKFRTCDNCIEVDVGTLAGVVIGDVVATIVVGVAVYLIASAARPTAYTPHKKSSDKQQLIPNRNISRAPNDDYQKLRFKDGNKETYDVIQNKR